MSTELDNRNDDDACGKLWEIYVKEAQQYDEGMVKSWKEDMDSMLVFSGLYSAILTAFVIESYQNLIPDMSEDSTVLLRRISEQLSSSSTLTPIPDPLSFAPTNSAFTCNILWFTSLSLALTCAFLATLVQQWSRRFLHRTSTVRSPGAHAHLLQFLYFGLKNLRMHAVVDLIPSLLHLSLFCFFAGLIAFLHDVSRVLTWILTTALSLVLLIYAILTILPLYKLDSPYATPLSSVVWRLLPSVRGVINLIPSVPYSLRSLRLRIKRMAFFHRRSTDSEAQANPLGNNAVDYVTDESSSMTLSENSERQTSTILDWTIVGATLKASRVRRAQQESKSILWTLQSLNDDVELLPFVEALPDALQQREDRALLRASNFHLVRALVESVDGQSNVILRILELMENTKNTWHSDKHRERCATACARALYSLGHVLVVHCSEFMSMRRSTPIFSIDIINRIGQGLCSGALDKAYGQSALVLCTLSSFLWIGSTLSSGRKNASVSSFLIQQAMALGQIDWKYNVWLNLNMSNLQAVHSSQAPAFITGAIGKRAN